MSLVSRLMSEHGYEFFDHTADVGIKAYGQTLTELFIHCAQGLRELIAEDSRIDARQARTIQLSAADVESLLLAWLNKLLFWFSTERFLPERYELEEVIETMLCGRVYGEVFNPARHISGTEVKGITRHQLHVRQANGCWESQVIFDV